MANYQRILLATELFAADSKTARQAIELAGRFGAELGVIHVVEPPPLGDSAYGVIMPFDFDLTRQMLEGAQQRLAELAGQWGIPQARQWVEVGSPKAEIVRVAAEQNMDLIVIGTHGRHGFGVLLGSTAASVVHHAGCDVLTVRLRDA
ncbi:MAG: universal stress protein [Candidatus Methylumidiphilus sp.]